MSGNSFRKHLSMPGMLHPHPHPINTGDFSLSDCLMSALAVFSLKFPSLLQFDRQVRGGEGSVQARNLRSLLDGLRRTSADLGGWHRPAFLAQGGTP